jgi:hypothetical protein
VPQGPGQHKQLLEGDPGVPLLVRTCKRLITRECLVVIVTPHEAIRKCIFDNLPNECISHQIDFIDVGQPLLLVDTIAATERHWTAGETNIGLMADVFFSDQAMRTILDTPAAGTRWFGRARPSRITGGSAELFGWSWSDPQDTPAILAGLRRAREHADSLPAERDMLGTPLGGLWQLHRGALGLPLTKEAEPAGNWVEINDFTDDWDTPENYQKWQDAYRRRIICQPRFTCQIKNPPSS